MTSDRDAFRHLAEQCLNARENRVIVTFRAATPQLLVDELHDRFDPRGLEIRFVESNDLKFDQRGIPPAP